ncbi:hypothetical protein PR001_g14573 [Phytophthora rubi]|uniref:Uncharacterized protein n=1 Tax=Phytophthora rubi TaxID=129364 RepID=A0A6A3KVA7_9STRA|nr:hypothetical protein PR002_g15279 [Phytophthora rubi]KAE9016732.1 hypothetical protein PR001_g14573 [Phytophthora rubi]
MVCRYTCFCSTCLALPSSTCCYWSSSSSFMAAVATGTAAAILSLRLEALVLLLVQWQLFPGRR